jgi:hypothetical protein
MSQARLRAMDPARAGRTPRWRVAGALRSVGPALLFGLRVWAAVSLSLYVAFWLELDNAYWAGTSAAIVCQPSLGASLRKASFRMIGTVVGAVAIVVLTACFPQSRIGFLMGLAAWGAACGFVATVLRNFASYGAALAGFTAVVIASDLLGATGGVNGDAFTLAVTRVSEICIGIVCAGIVVAGTDFGRARSRLAAQFVALSAEVTAGLSATLAGPIGEETRSTRRDLIRRVIALEPIIDEAIGESSDLRYRLRGLQAAVGGLFAALSGWRMVANHLELLPNDERKRAADAVLRNLPWELRSAPRRGDATPWTADPPSLAQGLRSRGEGSGSAPSRHAIAATVGRRDGGGLDWHIARTQWSGAADRFGPRRSASARCSCPCSRFAPRSRQCDSRAHRHRRCRALLDRYRMAERCLGRDMVRDIRHHVFAGR